MAQGFAIDCATESNPEGDLKTDVYSVQPFRLRPSSVPSSALLEVNRSTVSREYTVGCRNRRVGAALALHISRCKCARHKNHAKIRRKKGWTLGMAAHTSDSVPLSVIGGR
jgi:hypothetical protein